MGNNVATGHVVAMTQVSGAIGVKKTLQLLMRQHEIEPWSARELVQDRLQRQQQLCGMTPFRFIAVEEGLQHYSTQVGGWIVQLTREKFVKLSLDLFKAKGLTCPAEEATIFYDVFDSIDLDKNASLSVGELAGGLSTFFGGTLDQRTRAVYSLLDPKATDKLEKPVLSEFLKPYIYSMVPESAEVLRPILLSCVTDDIQAEMSFSPKSYVTCNEMVRWMQRGHPSAVQLNMSHTVAVFAKAIIERGAMIIENVTHAAWQEYQGEQRLREYGQRTWESTHNGQSQRLMDVGMYRYAASHAGSPSSIISSSDSPDEQPTLLNNLWTSMSREVNEAMTSFSSPGFCRPRSVTGISQNDIVEIVEPFHREMTSEDLISQDPRESCATSRLPNLLPTPVAAPPPLSALPPKACGLTLPQGFSVHMGSQQMNMPPVYAQKGSTIMPAQYHGSYSVVGSQISRF
jgi:hypothetical protein